MTTQRRVSWNDCDPSGLIRFQALFDWIVDAEVEFLRERGVEWVFGAMPRVAANATYTRPMRYDDLVEIDLSVSEMGNSSLSWSFVVRFAGEQAASGSITCVYVEHGRSAPLPYAVRDALSLEKDG